MGNALRGVLIWKMTDHYDETFWTSSAILVYQNALSCMITYMNSIPLCSSNIWIKYWHSSKIFSSFLSDMTRKFKLTYASHVYMVILIQVADVICQDAGPIDIEQMKNTMLFVI